MWVAFPPEKEHRWLRKELLTELINRFSWPSANCSTTPSSNSILVSFCPGFLCHNYEFYGTNTFTSKMFCKSEQTNPLVRETRSHIRLWFRWLEWGVRAF